MYDFELKVPGKLAGALRMLENNEDAQILAGGQTLIPTLKQRLNAPSVLISLGSLGGLRGVTAEDGFVTIGAMTCHADVAANAGAYPALAELAGGIGDPAVRNRGTIGGSIANNDPSACYPAAVLGSGATIVTKTREIAADDFFTGLFETALEEKEIITGVNFPVPQAAAYAKFEQPASRFAMVGVFVAKTAAGVRVAVTGASEDGVFRWAAAEDALNDEFTVDALEGMAPPADGMIADLHGSAEYRAHLVGVMARRAVAAAG